MADLRQLLAARTLTQQQTLSKVSNPVDYTAQQLNPGVVVNPAPQLLPNSIAMGTVSGASIAAVILDPDIATSINPIWQATINNTGAGNANIPVRIGGPACLAGENTLYGLQASAADSAFISDDYGAKVLKLQGWGKMLRTMAIGVAQIRVLQNPAGPQLNQTWTYKSIRPDMSIEDRQLVVSYTQEKSDYRSDIVDIRLGGILTLNDFQWLEFTALAGAVFTIQLTMVNMATGKIFKPIQMNV